MFERSTNIDNAGVLPGLSWSWYCIDNLLYFYICAAGLTLSFFSLKYLTILLISFTIISHYLFCALVISLRNYNDQNVDNIIDNVIDNDGLVCSNIGEENNPYTLL